MEGMQTNKNSMCYPLNDDAESTHLANRLTNCTNCN